MSLDNSLHVILTMIIQAQKHLPDREDLRNELEEHLIYLLDAQKHDVSRQMEQTYYGKY
jgi:hypothetical protein